MEGLSKELDIDDNALITFIETMVLYTHGMASMIVTGVIKEDKVVIHNKLRNLGISFFISLGVEKTKATLLFET